MSERTPSGLERMPNGTRRCACARARAPPLTVRAWRRARVAQPVRPQVKLLVRAEPSSIHVASAILGGKTPLDVARDNDTIFVLFTFRSGVERRLRRGPAGTVATQHMGAPPSVVLKTPQS